MNLEIDTETAPPENGSRPGESKYAAYFERLRPGQSIKTTDGPAAVAKIATALRSYLKRTGHSKTLHVVVQSKSEDGAGRVFLMRKPTKQAAPKMSDLPSHVVRPLG